MILFELKCSNDHHFEAWFSDGTSYDRQEKRGEVECPVCGDCDVAKAPMAPRLAPSRQTSNQRSKRIRARVAEVEAAVGRLRKEIESNCDYVGDQFAEEARAIHYGEADERGIYGETTAKEAIELAEEEIEIYRIPGKVRKDA